MLEPQYSNRLDNFSSKSSCNGLSKAIINTLSSCELIQKNKVTSSHLARGASVSWSRTQESRQSQDNWLCSSLRLCNLEENTFCEENLIVQNLKPGQAGHQVAGQGGEVVRVEGERDQLRQVGQAGRVQAPDLVVVQLER